MFHIILKSKYIGVLFAALEVSYSLVLNELEVHCAPRDRLELLDTARDTKARATQFQPQCYCPTVNAPGILVNCLGRGMRLGRIQLDSGYCHPVF